MSIQNFVVPLIWAPFIVFSQNITGEIVAIENPSFENMAMASFTPSGWMDCGFPGESPVDIQPSGAWEVYQSAEDGRTYMGMVTRENGTWEAVGQKLSTPLKENNCYTFSVFLCRSNEYWSAVIPDSLADRTTPVVLPEKNFIQPVVLQLWAGIEPCQGLQLLGESPIIDHTDWRKYEYSCLLDINAEYLIVMAYYAQGTNMPYNGNLLVDHMSDFTPILCK